MNGNRNKRGLGYILWHFRFVLQGILVVVVLLCAGVAYAFNKVDESLQGTAKLVVGVSLIGIAFVAAVLVLVFRVGDS